MDTTTVDLGRGRTAVVRNPWDMPNRVRRRAMERIEAAVRRREYGASTDWAALDVAYEWAVLSWTLELPVPSEKPDVLDDLDVEAANALYEYGRDFVVPAVMGRPRGAAVDEAAEQAAIAADPGHPFDDSTT